MFQPRVIPVLLLRHGALVKSIRFGDFDYLGDPVNAIRILSDFGADELLVLDIGGNRRKGSDLLDLVGRVSGYVSGPLAVGGGVTDLRRIGDLIGAGAEKIVISTAAVDRLAFVSEAAREFGSSSISVCIDVRRDAQGRARVWTDNGRNPTDHDPVRFAESLAASGAGEILVQSIDRDGTMSGYDLPLVRAVAAAVCVPVVALGGAGTIEHMREAHRAGASAVAAGSAFVYFRERGDVLINYPPLLARKL